MVMYRPPRRRQGLIIPGVKIATWNVNGIRARAAQLSEWLARDRPDVVCLQELKATAAQIPAESKLPDYHAYWHTLKGYSGVSTANRSFRTCSDTPEYPFRVCQ